MPQRLNFSAQSNHKPPVFTSGFEYDYTSGNIYAQELPEAVSNVWAKGFIWKGVFLKRYSKKEAERLKQEMRSLKQLAVEYLQTESLFRFSDGNTNMPSMSLINMNESLSQDAGRAATQIIQVILPLITVVESSSWVLLGTPIFPKQKNGSEDNFLRALQEPGIAFHNSYLLSNTNHNNYKVYNKPEDLTGTLQSGVFSGLGSFVAPTVSFALLSNTQRVMPRLPKVQVMFMIAQDDSVNIMFTEFPKQGIIEYTHIKKLLGYSELDISLASMQQKKGAITAKAKDQNLSFELLKFKKREWRFNLIYVKASSNTSQFPLNHRATELASKQDTPRLSALPCQSKSLV